MTGRAETAKVHVWLLGILVPVAAGLGVFLVWGGSGRTRRRRAAAPSVHFAAAQRAQRQAAASLGIPVVRTLDLGGATMELALIPAGEFLMGSPADQRCRDADEGPLHPVTITKAFYIGTREVTQRQYRAVTGEGPSDFADPNHPVERVSWAEAVAFCKALAARTSLAVRLPTEAEWEYACRAGCPKAFSFDGGSRQLFRYGNYCELANTDLVRWQDEYHNDGWDRTAPAGTYSPNAWGLYDTHGNVWEWCGDWFDDRGYGSAGRTDPTGPPAGTQRVVRGGSWLNNSANCRSANRAGKPPASRDYTIGFRVAVEIAPRQRSGRRGKEEGDHSDYGITGFRKGSISDLKSMQSHNPCNPLLLASTASKAARFRDTPITAVPRG